MKWLPRFKKKNTKIFKKYTGRKLNLILLYLTGN